MRRFYSLFMVLGLAMWVGCGREQTNPEPDVSITGSPRTTADQTSPGMSGSTYSNRGRDELRKQRHVAKPVIVDSGSHVEPDNTRVNRRDADPALTKTPTDQGERPEDVDATAAIRKRVMDIDLSTNGKNVKIITADGKVTLRGVVASDEEKQTIEQIAREVAGDGNVENQLQVKRE